MECAERLAEQRSLLGREQEHWLAATLAQSEQHWNVVAQQTLMAQHNRKPPPARQFWSDVGTVRARAYDC